MEGTWALLARDVDAKHYADGRWTVVASRLSNEAAEKQWCAAREELFQ